MKRMTVATIIIIILIILFISIISVSNFIINNYIQDSGLDESVGLNETEDFINRTIKNICERNNLSNNTTIIRSYKIRDSAINYSYFSNISGIFGISGNAIRCSDGYKIESEFNSRLSLLKVDKYGITYVNFSLREKSKNISKEQLINKSIKYINKISSREKFYYVNHSKRTGRIGSENNDSTVITDSSYIIEFRQKLNNYTFTGRRGKVVLEICNDNIVAFGDSRVFINNLIFDKNISCKTEREALEEALFQKPQFKNDGKPLDLGYIKLCYGVNENGNLVPFYSMLFDRGSYYYRTVEA